MTSIAEIANVFQDGGTFIIAVMEIACFVLGFVFICMSYMKYKIHRSQPKLEPLPGVILMLILGLVISAIPFINKSAPTSQKSTSPKPAYYSIGC